jgi:AcrR family transcriptional regulator
VSRRILPAPPGSVKDGSSRRSAVDAFADAPPEDDFAGFAVAVADADSEWPSAAAAAGDATGVARRTRRREARREAILRVAAPLFVRKGFAATSLDDVATALGLTRPAIYHYFTDKHQILLEIVERGFNNLSREARTIARGEGRAIDKLERIFHLHLSRVAADPQAIFLVIAEAGDLAPSARAVLKRRQQTYETVLTTLFEEAMADGDLAPSNPRLLIKGMVSLANWVYAWYDPRGLYRHEDIARFFWALFRAGAADPCLTRLAGELDNDHVRPRRRTQRSG